MKSKMEFIDKARSLDRKLTERNAELMYYNYWERSIKSLKNGKRNSHNRPCQEVAA